MESVYIWYEVNLEWNREYEWFPFGGSYQILNISGSSCLLYFAMPCLNVNIILHPKFRRDKLESPKMPSLCYKFAPFLTALRFLQSIHIRHNMLIHLDQFWRDEQLPVEQRIMFKVLLITFKALNDKAPSYIRDMLVLRQNQRQLRSSSQTLLSMPKSRLRTAGDRTFSYQAALLWNALPESLRTLTAVDPFKRHLKTYLFQIAYA